MMHLADQRQPTELRLKGSASGKNYIGPAGEAGVAEDREIVSFDGRMLITRFVDPDAGNRYGNMIYVRCGTPGGPSVRARTAPAALLAPNEMGIRPAGGLRRPPAAFNDPAVTNLSWPILASAGALAGVR